jgi:hypothetical protein
MRGDWGLGISGWGAEIVFFNLKVTVMASACGKKKVKVGSRVARLASWEWGIGNR